MDGGGEREAQLGSSWVALTTYEGLSTSRANARSSKGFQGRNIWLWCAVRWSSRDQPVPTGRQVWRGTCIHKSLICIGKAKLADICSFFSFFVSPFLFPRVGGMVTGFKVPAMANSFTGAQSIATMP